MKVSSLNTSQDCIENSSQCNRVRKGNKRNPSQRKRRKTESTVNTIIYVKITWTLQKTHQNEYVNLAMLQDTTSIYKINCIHIYQQQIIKREIMGTVLLSMA